MSPVERPTSPHLSVYRPQITSVLSITHRLTGLALYAGGLVLVVWLMVAAYQPFNFSNFTEWFLSPLGKALFGLWTLALYYHFCNGIRHLFWDMGKGFELRTVTISGVITMLAALGLTLASWCYAYYLTEGV